MIAHVSLPVSDFQKSKTFYLKALTPLGYRNNMEYGEAAGFNDGKNTDFWISKETSIVPTHVAFEASTAQQVTEFYKAALAAGGRTTVPPATATTGPATTLLSFTIQTATTLKRFGTTTANPGNAF